MDGLSCNEPKDFVRLKEEAAVVVLISEPVSLFKCEAR